VKTIVLVEKLAQSAALIEDQFDRALSTLSLDDAFNKARAVFIKPNLTYPSYRIGVTTRREFVEQLVASLRKINSTTKIYIGEGEGGYNSYAMTDAMRGMGFYELETSYPNVNIVNISKLPARPVELQAKGKPYLLHLPTLILDEIDFSITCPLPKVHCMTKITLSFKNQWGCLPDAMRLKNHYVFDDIIGQVCEKLKFRYAFLDGKYGLDHNGPMIGDPIQLDWFAAANSLGAFDSVVAEMMGINWQNIGHLKTAFRNGFIPKRDQIEIIGDIHSLNRKFTLNRNIWNYPALAAFHSSKLTYLFYFSKASGALHDIMYTFRKRPIE
jgi:uncharacterized protein (DUF362 family)